MIKLIADKLLLVNTYLNRSLWNDVEASFVCELCRQIQETSRGNVRVAVVTPYQKHRAHLTNKLRTQYVFYSVNPDVL